MKKRTTLITLIVALALLVGSAIGIGVSAEGDGALDLYAMNVSYGDNVFVIIAVDTDVANAENVEVSYTLGGESYTATLWEGKTYTEGGVEYPLFFTRGIAPKDCGLEIVAEAHTKGADYTAKTYSVSVAKYLYNLLYAQGKAEATEGEALEEKEFYESALSYIAGAEKVLHNQKVDASEARVPVTERSYVYATDAIINESGMSDILLAGATGTVTLTKNADAPADAIGWKVTSYTADGIVNKVVAFDTAIEIDATTVITPAFDPKYDFEDGTLPEGITVKDATGNSLTSGAKVEVVNEKLHIAARDRYHNYQSNTNADMAGANPAVTFNAVEVGNEGGFSVEMDVKFNESFIYSNWSSGNHIAIEFYNGETKVNTIAMQVSTTAGSSSIGIANNVMGGFAALNIGEELHLNFNHVDGRLYYSVDGYDVDLGSWGSTSSEITHIVFYIRADVHADIEIDNVKVHNK